MAVISCGVEPSVLAECPVWDWRIGRLVYLDLLDPSLVVFDPQAGTFARHPLRLKGPLGGLCLRAGGGYITFSAQGAHAISATFALIGTIRPAHQSFERSHPNDACVGPGGEILIATADDEEKSPNGGLFVLSAAHGWQKRVDGLTVGNGPAFSPDAKLVYLVDSPKGEMLVFDWDQGALELANRRVFARVPNAEGFPDGLTVDASGEIWSARWAGSRLVRLSAKGNVLETIALPTKLVTSAAFGGPDLSTLYITTANEALDGAESREHIKATPGDRLFRLEMPGIRGVNAREARL